MFVDQEKKWERSGRETSYTNQLNPKVEPETIKGQRKINELASGYEKLHSHMVNQWKRKAIKKRHKAFSSKQDRESKNEKS